MTNTMQAIVVHGREDYRLEQVPIPVPGPGEALVKVQAVGICASDLKCYHGAHMYWGDGPVPPNLDLQVIPGHEFVGEIVAIDDQGRQRWGVDVGDRVVSEQIVPCWKCRYCQRGQYWMCAPHRIYGFRRVVNGAMAEYMIYPADAIVHKVSKDIPAAHAAFAEPLSCALHAVERAQISFGDVVVVAGCGPIGLGMIAGARAKSPAHVIALDLAPAKLDLARACGADIVVNITEENAEEIVRSLTDGYGADVYLEATGHPSAVPQGLNLLRKLGRYVEYGIFGKEVSVDWSIISDVKELDVLGAHLGPYCWPTAITMIESGVLPMDRICSHQLPLDEFQKGLDLVGSGSESVKVTLLPIGGADT
ncbi:alcohol dehydrogenase catalytic domain-containing protein [Rhodococcus opacus]|uniref:alcohol dehydrogenase catalytic domain-containing protein n=1 Tax=Rhodococcus opacus TaxID=37919 RepID=UPI001C45CDC2|nr:alcohol dehydrogenase catalytic domain-containing protein [Rhodococcus opacus]MBV6760207.1 alcohol dehydrogenase catalytic domain-containing protein [Rhodococcus opacus]